MSDAPEPSDAPELKDEAGLPAEAYAAALASLPGAGPGWLAEMLSNHPPQRAWELVRSGRAGPTRGRRPAPPEIAGLRSSSASGRIDVASLWERCRRRAIGVTWPGVPSYPSALAAGPAPPGVLFFAGDIAWVERCPVVAVVGTRRCSPEGARTAFQLGRELAEAGVCVVSGLALGIDGAAHAGAVAGFGAPPAGSPSAPTVGVAASGVDVVYPRQHGALWRQVVATGAVVSETPPGTPAQPWRFPARNRVIAGLARMVVVVESHVTGGSWHTVDAALRRGVEVGVVPGSVHSPASAGTNAMLRDGATPVRGAQDVLDALGLWVAPSSVDEVAKSSGEPGPQGPGPQGPGPQGPRAQGLGPLEERVLAVLGWRPLCLEEVVESAGLPVNAAVVALDRLETAGVAVDEGGWWRRRA